MLKVSEGLVFSHAFIPSQNKSTKDMNVLSINGLNHTTLEIFVNLFNNDTTNKKKASREFFKEHLIPLMPKDQECLLLQKIKQIYLDIKLQYLWDKKLPAGAIQKNPIIHDLTNQFFEQLNNQINQPQM